MRLEQRVEIPEKEVAALKEQVSEQPKRFIPEDSDGTTYSLGSISIAPQTTNQE